MEDANQLKRINAHGQQAATVPAHVDACRPKLAHWADLLASRKADAFTEQEILPDFLTDFFCELLGYTRPADGGPCYARPYQKKWPNFQPDRAFLRPEIGFIRSAR